MRGRPRRGQSIPRREEVVEVHVHVGLGLHFLDVGPGREGPFGSGDQNGTDLGICIEFLDHRHDLTHQLRVQRVQCFRTVQRDDADASPAFEQDGFVVGH